MRGSLCRMCGLGLQGSRGLGRTFACMHVAHAHTQRRGLSGWTGTRVRSEAGIESIFSSLLHCAIVARQCTRPIRAGRI